MKVHFIGIGGIGVSALAQHYLKMGHQVSGSDLVRSEITDNLKQRGIKINIGKNIIPDNIDLLIYTSSAQLGKLKVPSLSYAQALGQLTKEYFTIAVSGTHGKSTTTAMLASLLVKAGLDPTVIIGTKLKEFGDTNYRAGKSKYLLIEADEHFASFLNYWPSVIVLTNIEEDHLDYYKNLNNILKTFKEYISRLAPAGTLIVNQDDLNIKKIISEDKFNVKYYSLKDKVAKELKASLKVPGEHNVYNALAALSVARLFHIPDELSLAVLAKYRGAWRRFDKHKVNIPHRTVGQTYEHLVISDYAHHPNEVKATLKAMRDKYPKDKIWVVFQPHQKQRTFYFFEKFVKILKEAPIDKIMVTDIYNVAGREEEEFKVSAKQLVDTVARAEVVYLPQNRIISYLKDNLKRKEIVVIMGAGDIYRTFLNLIKKD